MEQLTALRHLRSSDRVVLDKIKDRIAMVDGTRFTRDSTSFDMGYNQAHRDLKAFIAKLEQVGEVDDKTS